MINILHISDIHFRADESSEERQCRKDVLDKFIKYICLLKDEQRPNIILVTGDIAYIAKDEEYQLALEWFNELSASTGIPHNKILFCPGNHDVNRKARTTGGALRIRESANASDNDFKRWQYKFYPLFESYTKFCSAFKSIPYRFGRKFKPSYIIGGRPVANGMINIICLNSLWYHFDIETAVYGNLWMGLPLLKEMNGFQLPMESEYDKSAINIGLCHHPKDWLHKDERIKYVSDTGDREVTWEYLLNRIHIMFHGHIEGENIFLPQQNGKRGYEIIGGALYYKPQHQHSFNIIRLNVEDRNFEFYAYQYKNNDWSLVPNTDDNKYDLMANKKTTLRITPQIIYPTISLHIENLPLTVYKDFLVKVRFFENAVLDNEMSFYTKITIEKSNNHIEISNDDDILRSLNLHMSFNMQGYGSHILNISLPESKHGSVEATLFREQLLSFMSYGCKHEISYNDIAFLFGTIPADTNMRTSQFEIDFLSNLLQVQNFFNKNIDLPEEIFEQDEKSLNELLSIKNDGCIEKSIGIDIHFSLLNRDFKDFLIKYNDKHCFYGIIDGDYNFKIVNTTIPVGNRNIVFTNMQIVDYDRALQKSSLLDDCDSLSMKAKSNRDGKMIIIYEKYTSTTLADIVGDNIALVIDRVIDYNF